MKLLTKVLNIFDRTLDLLAVLGAILIVFAMLSIIYSVVMRYGVKHGAVWVMETVEYTLLWVVFLGAAWLLRREGHIKVDLLLNRLNPRMQALFNVITSVMGAITCLALTWYGAQMTWTYFQHGTVVPSIVEPPQAPIMAIIFIGSFFLFIQFIRRAHGYLSSWTALGNQGQRL